MSDAVEFYISLYSSFRKFNLFVNCRKVLFCCACDLHDVAFRSRCMCEIV
jgi:hypothetical protein